MPFNKSSTALAAVVLFQAGWIAGSALSAGAHAETPEVAYAPPSLRMLCSVFPVDVAPGATVETADPSTPIGAWLAEKSKDWSLYMIDFEIGQKSTGFPQPMAQVCLIPR